MDYHLFKRSCQYRKPIFGRCFSNGNLWFIFSPLIQHDLDRVKEEWNLHKIRKYNRTNVYGIPDELYLWPESRGYVQCGKNVTDAEVSDILHYQDVHSEVGNINKRFDQNLLDYIKYVLQEHHTSYPSYLEWSKRNVWKYYWIGSAMSRPVQLNFLYMCNF